MITTYRVYNEAVCRTLWNWAGLHHRGKLDGINRHDRPPVLAERFALHNVLVPPDGSKATAIRYYIAEDQRHQWFRSLKSSQALTQSVFGAISAFNRLDLLRNVPAECGRPAFIEDNCDTKLVFEHEVRSLGEPRPTNVDVLLSSSGKRVAIECKFTEQEFGTCSRPRLRPRNSTYDEQYCDGNYRLQRERLNRCALTEIGIQYWDYLPRLFTWEKGLDLVPCPFKDVYQLARNALAAVVTADGKLDLTKGHVLVVYDARNPEFRDEGKAERQWRLATTSCRVPGLVRRLSWQRLMGVLAQAPELAYLVDSIERKYGVEPD